MSIELLEQGLKHTQKIVDTVKPEQMAAPTPCEEWDVRALLNHMTGTVIMFGNALTDAGGPPEGDIVGDDPAGVFRQATKTTLDAWRQSGAMEKTLKLPIGDVPGAIAININFMDPFVHGLDLAEALSQKDLVDNELAEKALELSKQMGLDNFRGPGVFGPEVPCDEKAAASRRLLAFLGRKV